MPIRGMTVALATAGFVQYGLLLLFIALVVPYTVCTGMYSIRSTPSRFQALLFVFTFLRLMWFTSLLMGWKVIDFTLNRLALAFFNSALALLLFGWAEISVGAREVVPKFRNQLIVVNTVVWVVTAVELVVYFQTKSWIHRESNLTYELGVFVLATWNIVISIGFGIKGRQLANAIESLAPRTEKQSGKISRSILSIAVAAGVFVACFLLRFVLLLYRPITGQRFPAEWYYPLAYMVPELVPVAMQQYIFFKRVVVLARDRTDTRAGADPAYRYLTSEFDSDNVTWSRQQDSYVAGHSPLLHSHLASPRLTVQGS